MSFVTLTFAGQDRIIVNTNTFGTRKIAVFSTIEQTLGPFTRQNRNQSDLYRIMYHSRNPFWSGSHEKSVQAIHASLCHFFKEMYKLGWKTVTPTSSSFDIHKLRSTIIFKYSEVKVNTAFACIGVISSHLKVVAPIHHHGAILAKLSTVGSPFRTADIMELEYGCTFPLSRNNGTLKGSTLSIGHTRSGDSSDVNHVIQALTSLSGIGYQVESSMNVFGKGSFDLFILRFDPHTSGNVWQEPIWALAAYNPNQVSLTKCPWQAQRIVEMETLQWRQWPGKLFGRGTEFTPGKVAMDSLLSALAAKGYRCIGSINRSYKNTYFLMQKTKEPITVKPPLFSMSIISDKKVQFDDHIGSSVIIPELQSLLRKLDNLVAYGGTRSSYSKRVCVFNQGMFKYDYDERIALHLATFLLVLQMADSIGFSLYASGNISGRFVYNGEDKAISPHTWFFFQEPSRPSHPQSPVASRPPVAPPSPTPSAPPSYDFDGLPTYDEAMQLFDQGVINKLQSLIKR